MTNSDRWRVIAAIVMLSTAGCGPYRSCWNERENMKTVRTCCQTLEWTGPAIIGSWDPTDSVVCAPTVNAKTLSECRRP